MSAFLKRIRRIESTIQDRTGVLLKDLDLLEIGPGQFHKYLRYFGFANRPVGVDLDVVVDEISLRNVVRMLRVNGPTRTFKTLARKAIGADKLFNSEMARQLGVKELPSPPILQMNAEALSFGDASFDFVFSCSTFEHLPRPGDVVRECNRVLRPGGTACHMVHLYTSDSGCHDPRIMSGYRGDLPHWSHLRSQHEHKVRSNSYLNRIRLTEWESLFFQHVPQVKFEYIRGDDPTTLAALAEIRSSGELTDYTDQELVTIELMAMWTKPMDSQ
ncbi:class I SAM-dependent methyltransferase [Verrucomicrobiota bacterium sgz303538]